MEDVTVDEIIEHCPSITNRIIECLEYFLCSIKEFEDTYMTDCILNSNDVISCTNDVQEWLKNYNEDVSEDVTKNKNYFQMINEEMEKLKTSQTDIQKETAANQKKVEISKGKISKINKKKGSLGDLRDEIQMCKLLTGTSFMYKGSSISGYVASKHIECFEMNPETVPKNEIINSLYDKVEKASWNLNETG